MKPSKLSSQTLAHSQLAMGAVFPIRCRAKVIGLLRLVRLSNSLPAAFLVVLGARLTHAAPALATVAQAAAAMWSITAFGYLSNDLFDRQEDRINKPDRPLVAGVVTLPETIGLGLILLWLALWLSAGLGWLALSVACIVLGLLTIYNLGLKATAGGGNLLIGLLAGAALLSGAVAAQGWRFVVIKPLLWPAVTLALFITAREMVKTLEDIPGDQLAGKQTVAVAWGPAVTIRLVGLLAGLTLLASWLPWLRLGYSVRYLWLIQLGINLPLCLAVVLLYRAQRRDAPLLPLVKPLLWLLKGSYGVGLLALWWA